MAGSSGNIPEAREAGAESVGGRVEETRSESRGQVMGTGLGAWRDLAFSLSGMGVSGGWI